MSTIRLGRYAAVIVALSGTLAPLTSASAQQVSRNPGSSSPAAVSVARPSKNQIYGYVTASGAVMTGSNGILTVNHPKTGVYCVEPISTTLQQAVVAGTLVPTVSVDLATGDANIALVYTLNPIGCPTGAFIPIYTYNSSNGNPYDSGFVIAFN
jgi:hypothetical protein